MQRLLVNTLLGEMLAKLMANLLIRTIFWSSISSLPQLILEGHDSTYEEMCLWGLHLHLRSGFTIF